jgi:ABC-type transport system involved in multi-copper enzyme maturation permease subunit
MSRVVFLETLRRHFTSPTYLVFVGVITVVSSIAGATNSGAGMWQAFWSLLTIGIGAQLIGPEFSSGTLQLIMSKPVNRSAYLLSRWAGVVVAAWVAIAIPFVFDLGGRFLIYSGPPEWQPMVNSTGGEALHAVLSCALLALFGSISRSYFNVAIYFVLNIGLSLITGALRAVAGGIGQSFVWLTHLLQEHPAIIRGVETIHDNIYPDVPPRMENGWVILVLSNAAIVLLLACLMFRRREVPYGAD